MANTLVLKLIVDDKGTSKLVDLTTNLGKAEESAWSLGKTLERVFVSAAFLNALSEFKEAVAVTTEEITKFENTTRKLEGISNVSGTALKRISRDAIDLSNNTEFLVSALQGANLALTKMGIAPGIASKALPVLANMTTATGMEIGYISTVVMDIMRQFGMDITNVAEVQRAANVLFQVEAQTSINNFEEVAEAMKYVGPVGKALGVQFEEIIAIMGVLANAGSKGTIAGNAMKNMFLNLLKASPEISKALSKMNLETMSFTAILEGLDKQGISVIQFLETFDKRAITSVLYLKDNKQAVDDLTVSLKNQEVSIANVANIISGSWILQLARLKNTFINIGTTWLIIMEDNFNVSPIDNLANSFIRMQEWMLVNQDAIINYTNDVAGEIKKILTTVGRIGEFGIKYFDEITKVMKVLILQSIIFNKHLMVSSKLMTVGGATPIFKSWNAYALILIASMEIIDYFLNKWIAQSDKFTASMDFSKISNVDNALKALDDYTAGIAKIKAKQAEINAQTGMRDTNYEKYYTESLINELSKRYNIHKKYFEDLNGLEIFEQYKGLDIIRQGLIDKDKLEKEMAAKIEAAKKVPYSETLGKSITTGLDGEKDAKQYWEAWLDYANLTSKGVIESFAKIKAGISPTTGKMLEKGENITNMPDTKFIQSLDEKQLQNISTSGNAEKYASGSLGISTLPVDMQPIVTILWESKYDEATKELMDIQSEEVKINIKISEGYVDEIGVLQEQLNTINEQEAKDWEDKKELMYNYFNGFAEAASMTLGTINDIQSFYHNETMGRYNTEMEAMERKFNRQNDLAKGSVYRQRILEQQQAKDKNKLQKKMEKEEKEYKEKQKAYAIVDTLINGAVAFMAAMRATPWPVAIAMSALVAASTTASVAMIASQKYWRGGLINGGGNTTSDSVPILASRGEYMVNANDVSSLGGGSAVSRLIDDKINGLTTSSSKNIYVRIDTLIGEPEYERKLFVRLKKEYARW